MIITVEGNIGSGKSVLSSLLHVFLTERCDKVELFHEPLERWTDVGGKNLLQLYYEDKEKWAFTFQVNALITSIELEHRAIELSKKNYTIIRERSPFSVLELFSKLLLNESILDGSQIEVLKRLQGLVPNITDSGENHYVIYIKTPPETCFSRVQKRNRLEEIEKVDLKYLQTLHDIHEDKFANVSNENLILIDGESYTENVFEEVKIMNSKITLIKLCEDMLVQY